MANVKLYYGNEPYCVRNAVNKATEGVSELAVKTFGEYSPQVYEAARQVPFLSEKQVIVCYMEKLPTEKEGEEFLKKLATVPAYTELILLPEQVLKNTKVFKGLSKVAEVKEFNKVDRTYLKKLISQLVEKNGAKMEVAVLEHFIDRIGYCVDDAVTLYTVNTAVKQLCLTTASITREDVDALVEPTVSVKMWGLSSILLRGEKEKLMRMAEQLLANKESGIGMLSSILKTFRVAYKVSLGAAEKELGVTSYSYKDALKYPPQTLFSCMEILQDGVNAIKNGKAEERVVFLTALSDVVSTLETA